MPIEYAFSSCSVIERAVIARPTISGFDFEVIPKKLRRIRSDRASEMQAIALLMSIHINQRLSALVDPGTDLGCGVGVIPNV